MSLAAPEQDEVTDLSEFEEFEIPCEIPRVADRHCGGNPAEWIAYRTVICRCGIIVRLVCTACKVDYQQLMANHGYIYCPTCLDETKGFNRFEPLKQKS